jgi:outer membrane protein TolC
LALAQTSYRVGRGDQRAVRQQQLNVHAARLALLRAQNEQLAQRVSPPLVLGGSFAPSPPLQASGPSN